MSIDAFIKISKALINRRLKMLVPQKPLELKKALTYAIGGKGKRLRPLLMLATVQTLQKNIPAEAALNTSIALEYVHIYSCIHDDLPSMDDDCLRHGRPALHIAFPEWLAILSGDCLLTQAFAILANLKIACEKKILLIAALSEAAGAAGMIGGQVLDMRAENCNLTAKELSFLHNMKTGALIRAAVSCGAILGEADSKTFSSLQTFAKALGEAYQIVDDILDATGSSGDLGKTAGKDAAKKKSTAVTILGLKAAQKKAQKLKDTALAALEELSVDTSLLKDFAFKLLNRNN